MNPQSRVRSILVVILLLSVVGATAVSAQQRIPNGFHAFVGETRNNPTAHAPIAEWLKQTGLLEKLSEGFAAFKPERPVYVTSNECGVANAFYKPAEDIAGQSVSRIILCYEFVSQVINEFRYDGMEQAKLNAWVAGTVGFVLVHEFGHALVDLLDLPITGREEDAVDQLATLILAQSDPQAAYAAAEFFKQAGDWGDLGVIKTPQSFADEHSLNEQRFFNILCWTYGGNPTERFLIGERVPTGRRERCTHEWKQLESSWSRLLEQARPGVFARQPADSTPATRPVEGVQPTSVASEPFVGRWEYSENFQDALGLIKCNNTGNYVIGRTGSLYDAEYGQTGSCKVLGQASANNGTGKIPTLEVGRALIRFEVGGCRYEGFLASNEKQIDGTVQCDVDIGGKKYGLHGKWAATKR